MSQEGFVPSASQGENLVSFLTHETLPSDLRMTLHRDLVTNSGTEVKEVLRHKALAEMTLASM